MYEIIEKNQYGVLVRKIKSIPTECEKCKYTGLAVALQPCKSCKADNSYYLPDSEAEKLESENPLMNTTIDDLYIESKCYFEVKKKLEDTQKELIDLRVELRVEKEKSKALEEYSRGLELKVNELENKNNVQDFVTCLHCGNKFERYKEYPLQEMCNKCLKELTN